MRISLSSFLFVLVFSVGWSGPILAISYPSHPQTEQPFSSQPQPHKPWSLGLSFGGGLNSTQKVIGYIQGGNVRYTNPIIVRPGGGLGFYITASRQIAKNLVLNAEVDFQFSRIRPTFLNYSIRFVRYQASVLASYSFPLYSFFLVEAGLGPVYSFRNQLLLLASSANTQAQPSIRLNFQPELGLTSQLLFHFGDPYSRFFIGPQWYWLRYQIRNVEVEGEKFAAGHTMKAFWGNLNGNGLWLKAGIRWYL